MPQTIGAHVRYEGSSLVETWSAAACGPEAIGDSEWPAKGPWLPGGLMSVRSRGPRPTVFTRASPAPGAGGASGPGPRDDSRAIDQCPRDAGACTAHPVPPVGRLAVGVLTLEHGYHFPTGRYSQPVRDSSPSVWPLHRRTCRTCGQRIDFPSITSFCCRHSGVRSVDPSMVPSPLSCGGGCHRAHSNCSLCHSSADSQGESRGQTQNAIKVGRAAERNRAAEWVKDRSRRIRRTDFDKSTGQEPQGGRPSQGDQDGSQGGQKPRDDQQSGKND
jgi:hypothetical protein